MSLFNRFINYIQRENLFQKQDQILLAVSGGIDSAVLCELCYQAGLNFDIAHCNFQLRGGESERDEKFVRSLGKKFNVKVWVEKFDTSQFAKENKLGIQEAARNLRYSWFTKIINEKSTHLDEVVGIDNIYHGKPATYLATAHHAGDNVETLLMNFFKGTGIKGLRGIPNRREHLRWIVRPLLFAKREDIINFAKENNVSYVEDSSNTSDKYTRNYFRNQLIPSIQKVFPQVEENLLNNIERFRDAGMLYEQAIDFHKKKLMEFHGDEIHIPVLKLLKARPLKTIIYEIIKEYEFTSHQTEEVLHLLESESGKYISSETHRIIRNRKWIVIAPHNNIQATFIPIAEEDTEIRFELGTLKIARYIHPDHKLATETNIASLDANVITFPLLLRKWKQGDYFYPLGMRKKKKLSRFFTDQKMSLTEKEQVWVIESDKRIVWIVGKRIDDRCKVTDRTKNIITIHFNRS